MIVNFDIFNRAENPWLFICNPDNEHLAPVVRYDGLKIQPTFNGISTLSVNIYKYIGRKLTGKSNSKNASECYKYIAVHRQIQIEHLGYFIITQFTEKNDGIDPYYEVQASSCEIETNNKRIKLDAGNYKFYDAMAPTKTIIGKVLDLCPSWKLGSLPQSIQGKYRYFDDTSAAVYNFLSSTIERAFGCIIDFDCENRIINVIDSNIEIEPAGILMDFDNILKNVDIHQSTENIVTALTVTGANGLSISEVNPTGENYIFNFDYYKNLNWMTQDLIDAINTWEQKIENNKSKINSILVILKQHKTEVENLNKEISILQDELKNLDNQKSDLAGKNQDYSYIQIQIDLKNNVISDKSNLVKEKESIITTDYNQLHAIQSILKLENNFTNEQFLQLNNFIFENEYKNENISVNKNDAYSVIQENYLDLYLDGFKKLNQVCQPISDFEVDVINFLFIKAFNQFRRQFELGKSIDIEISPDNIVRFMLLQYEIDYNNFTLKLKLSNQLRIDDRYSAYQELYNKVTATSNTISKNKDSWNYPVKSGSIAEFDKFRQGVLNATLNKVVSSENEEILVDNTGIHGRTKDLSTGEYEPEQLWINKNNIMFSDDGFQSAKMAIGKIQLPDGTWVYGINADAILAGTVSASRLDLTGYAKFTDLLTAGNTIINGANITTGKISSQDSKVYFDLNNGTISASHLICKDAPNNKLLIGHVADFSDTGWGLELIDENNNNFVSLYNQYDVTKLTSQNQIMITKTDSTGLVPKTSVRLYDDRININTGFSSVQLGNDGRVILYGDISTYGDFNVTHGAKNAVVETVDYGNRAISAYETAEYYFGDIGYGEIINGECRIDIDPIFAQCVNTNIDYHVFLTAIGDSANLYVAETHRDYFLIKADKNVKFSWELKAKRLGYENVRLKEIDLKQTKSKDIPA